MVGDFGLTHLLKCSCLLWILRFFGISTLQLIVNRNEVLLLVILDESGHDGLRDLLLQFPVEGYQQFAIGRRIEPILRTDQLPIKVCKGTDFLRLFDEFLFVLGIIGSHVPLPVQIVDIDLLVHILKIDYVCL